MSQLSSEKLSVIVSCFNEGETIRECLERLVKTVPNGEIIVVHGGTDNTADVADSVARTFPQVRVVRNIDDRGKGHGIKVGIQHARHNLMLQLDADLQFMPEEIPKVIAPILEGKADISFGCRFMKESNIENYQFSFFRVVGNHIVNAYLSKLAGQRFYDITTGFKAWTRQAIDDVAFKDDVFVYEAEIAIRGSMKGHRIAMIPITYHNRLGGVSGHGAGWRETMSVVITGLKILLRTTQIRLGLW